MSLIHLGQATSKTARDAKIGLAAAEERVRLARELHDVLGHGLSVIALKAEVLGDLVRRDPARAEAEAELIRSLATGTLREVRQTVHGFGQLDLEEQLRGARLVLESAGIHADFRLPTNALSAGEQQLAAAVIREAVTNLLQHSDAEQVMIRLDGRSDRQVVVISNDGVRGPAGSPGIGLSGLRERAEAAGARLQAGLVGELFEVRLELAPR
jgi:two-component system sensor histidine kinase DesK